MGSPLVFGEVRVAYFCFVFCLVFFCLFVCLFVFSSSMLLVSLDCLRPVSCVPNVSGVSGLSNLNYLFGNVYLNIYSRQFAINLTF